MNFKLSENRHDWQYDIKQSWPILLEIETDRKKIALTNTLNYCSENSRNKFQIKKTKSFENGVPVLY